MIEVRHLSKRYGTHLAVDDLSFSIDRGVVYGFLGPNGAAIKHKHNKHKKEPGITPRLFRVPSLPACG